MPFITVDITETSSSWGTPDKPKRKKQRTIKYSIDDNSSGNSCNCYQSMHNPCCMNNPCMDNPCMDNPCMDNPCMNNSWYTYDPFTRRWVNVNNSSNQSTGGFDGFDTFDTEDVFNNDKVNKINTYDTFGPYSSLQTHESKSIDTDSSDTDKSDADTFDTKSSDAESSEEEFDEYNSLPTSNITVLNFSDDFINCPDVTEYDNNDYDENVVYSPCDSNYLNELDHLDHLDHLDDMSEPFDPNDYIIDALSDSLKN